MKINKTLSIQDFIFCLITLYLVLLPVVQSSPIGVNGLYNGKRFWQIALLLLICILIIVVKEIRRDTVCFVSLIPPRVLYSILGIFVLGFISSLFIATFPNWALMETGHFVMLTVSIFLIAAISFKDTGKFQFYLQVSVLGFVGIYLLQVFISYLFYKFGDYPLWPGSEVSIGLFGFADKRLFNHTQTWTIPLIASLGWYYWNFKKNRLYKYGYVLLLIGMGMLVIASGGRGTALGISAGGFLILCVYVKNKKNFVKYFLTTILLTCISYYTFFELMAKGTAPKLLRSGSTGRFELWLGLIQEIFAQPLFGHGPMHYASLPLNNWLGHPHNWFIQLSYEWGLIVSLIFLSLVVIGLLNFGRQIGQEGQTQKFLKEYWIKIGLLWSLLSATIHGLFSGIIVSPLSQIWFVLIVGGALGLYFKNSEKSTQNRLFSHKILLVTVLITISTFVYWGTSQPIVFKQSRKEYFQKTDSNVLYPRFWQQGKIGLEEYHPKNEKE